MKKSLWISVPLSLICISANAATPAPSTSTASAPKAPAATAPQSTITPAAAQSATPAPQAGSTITPAAAQSATTAAPAASTAVKAPVKKAAATSTTKAPAPKAVEAPKVGYSLIFDTNYTLQASTQPNGKRSQSQDYSLIPGISYGDYSGNVTFTYEQDLVDSTSDGFADPAFGASRKAWELNKYFKLGPSVALVLPMTDDTKNNVGLLYNIGAALSLSLNTKTLGWDAWSISTSVAFNRNFTKYDTKAEDGNPNTMYRIRQRYNVGYAFTDKLSLSTRFQFDSNTSVGGIVRNSFLHWQALGYAITDNVEVNFTHANSNSLYKPTTYESNLNFYDEQKSNYSIGMTVSI